MIRDISLATNEISLTRWVGRRLTRSRITGSCRGLFVRSGRAWCRWPLSVLAPDNAAFEDRRVQTVRSIAELDSYFRLSGRELRGNFVFHVDEAVSLVPVDLLRRDACSLDDEVVEMADVTAPKNTAYRHGLILMDRHLDLESAAARSREEEALFLTLAPDVVAHGHFVGRAAKTVNL